MNDPQQHLGITDKPTRRRLSIGRVVKWGAILFIVGLFVPIFPPIGFVGGVIGSFYYWKNPGRNGSSIAVKRELFLDVKDYSQTPYYYEPLRQGNERKIPELCRSDHIRKLEPGEPLPCIAAYADSNSYCNAWLINFSCNGIRVSGALWRDQGLRKRIISAALRPCKYLYDPGTGVVKNVFYGPGTKMPTTKFGTVEEPYHEHVTAWAGSACPKYRFLYLSKTFGIKLPFILPENETKTVFITIVDETGRTTAIYSDTNTDRAVYRATRNGDVVEGEYVHGHFDD